MTGFVPAIGFVPMAIATGTGADVQKPLATTVIGGLIAATILTPPALPAIAKVVLGADWQPKFLKWNAEPATQPATASAANVMTQARKPLRNYPDDTPFLSDRLAYRTIVCMGGKGGCKP